MDGLGRHGWVVVTPEKRPGSRSRLAAALGWCGLALLLVLSVGAATSTTGPATPAVTHTGSASTTPLPQARSGTALALLATLPVKGRGPMTGYSRDMFGSAWSDTDRNGCDQRNDILRGDLQQATLRAGTHGCVVMTGRLTDPYTGEVIAFTRSSGSASPVQIDHVVPLADAWVKGAARWSLGQRTAFANDPLNLIAVGAKVNAQKGAGDAATWLPPARGYRCAYVARQVAVKATYRLDVTSAERAALAQVLAACPATPVPTARVAPLGGWPTYQAPAPASAASP